MLRLLLLLAFTARAWSAAEKTAEEPMSPAPPEPIIWFATEPSAIDRFAASPTATARMVDQLIIAATGQRDIAAAWKTLVSPKDRIGLKVSAVGGRQFSTKAAVVEAILSGLEKAGIERRNVIVWDRHLDQLQAAGFTARQLGCQVRGVDAPRGWDRSATFQAPALGKLIWGDLLFVEKSAKKLGKTPPAADQLSSTSHFAKLVTTDLTKIINLPVLSDEANIGVAGAIYNVTLPAIDNWRRFITTEGGAIDSIPELYADEHLAPKIVLHLMDGLVAQYAGGPEGNPNYAFPHATLYASRDPLALDANAARRINTWRAETRLPSILSRCRWMQTAQAYGLGTFEESKITLRQVSPP